MKRFCLSVLAACTCIFGCQVEEMCDTGSVADSAAMAFYATIEDEGISRTSLDEHNNIRWSAGDQIVIFAKSTYGSKYQIENASVGKTSGTFSPVSQSGSGDSFNSGMNLEHNVALYPYSADVECDKYESDYKLPLELPAEQTYAAESFGNGSFPMVAVSETNNITFRNICGGMKLQLKGTCTIASIKVEGKNGEKLAGNASVIAYTDDRTPLIAMADDALTSVTLNCGDGVQIDESKITDFIISLPPTVFAKGFAITITDIDGGVLVIETSKVNEVKRSSLLTMPEVVVQTFKVADNCDYIDEYGINRGPGVEIDGTIWSPVNCGYEEATSQHSGSLYGKLYQWGRKYGQGYEYPEANFTKFVPAPAFVAEAEDEDNADKFFYVVGSTNSAFSSWDFPASRDTTLWNSGSEENPIKTIYDPCPDGWRVPTANELKSLFKNKSSLVSVGSIKGARFSGSVPYNTDVNNIFIPAAGRRDEYATREMRNSRVACWSSRYARYAYHAGNTSVLNFMGGSSALGHSVRCVRETEHNSHSLVVSQSSISIPSGLNSAKFFVESSDVAWSIISSSEDFIVIPSTGFGRAEVEVVCHSSSKEKCDIYIRTHAKRLYTDRQYIVTVTRERNDDICYIDDHGVNHGEGIAISGVVWAPVNCGYEEVESSEIQQRQGKGLYYQWGRKYGQGSSDGSEGPVSQVVEGPVSAASANDEANANVFYKPVGSDDWAISADYTLWNSGSQTDPVKTKYDPCPNGWRVPTTNEFKSLYENYEESSKNGCLGIRCYGNKTCSVYNPSVFLPSSDILSPSTGKHLHGSGLDVWNGNYWTSTRYSTGTYYMDFGSYAPGIPHTVSTTNTAWGRKVRCVHE